MNANRWLMVIVASSALAVIAAFAATGNALSMIPLLWFLAVIPGLPWVRMVWKDGDPVAFWLTVIGLSIAIDTLVAEVLLYTDAYTATGAVMVLAGVALLGTAIGRARTPAVVVDLEPAEIVEFADLRRSTNV
jgi:hypothetical protein